jgi:hypothetical protein
MGRSPKVEVEKRITEVDLSNQMGEISHDLEIDNRF